MFSQGGGKASACGPKGLIDGEKTIFHSQVHVTGKSFALSQTQVASYFSRQASKLKKLVLAYHMKEAAGAGDDGGCGDGGDGDGGGGDDGCGDDGDYSTYKVAEAQGHVQGTQLAGQRQKVSADWEAPERGHERR
jgi:hypothetical protein